MMGECRWVTNDGVIILDIPPNYPAFDTKDEADPHSIINGGSGIPVIKSEGRK